VADYCTLIDIRGMDIPLRKQFGQRVNELRLEIDMSQESFADHCGFARSYISRIERGGANPSLDAIAVLATALNVDVVELFKKPAEPLLIRSKRQNKSEPD
jgi:transcriptional regulator with XRE-family HTH domain